MNEADTRHAKHRASERTIVSIGGHGKVKWFNEPKGFGFICQDVGEDLFVHYQDIDVKGFRTLKQGQRVKFDVAKGEKGLSATNVVPVEPVADGQRNPSGSPREKRHEQSSA
ncbi:Cold shock protein, CspA family [Luteibacter sp. UNCMF331Sha3.1]|nr:Cold shock protein, CspA family [Luteibacter sp. UNCMF331Sha3.1]